MGGKRAQNGSLSVHSVKVFTCNKYYIQRSKTLFAVRPGNSVTDVSFMGKMLSGDFLSCRNLPA